MIVQPDDGVVAFPQSARAFLAFQLADHWGNRSTPRPRPRVEVLAAVMLGADGWGGVERATRTTHTPAQLFPAPPSQDEQESEWSAAVERSATYGRYVGYLVSHHVSSIAASAGLSHEEFLIRQATQRQRLVSSLEDEPRYRDVLRSPSDAVNRSVVRVCHALTARLTEGTAGETEIADLPQSADLVPLRMRQVADGVYRLRPWPFAGHRLRVHAEGRFVSTAHLADEAAIWRAYEAGKPRQMAWTLLAAGTPAD